jgi:IS30 family transposase
MSTQEEDCQRVRALEHQGSSINAIGGKIGSHPATVSKWLKAGGPPEGRRVNPSERVIDDRWARRIDALIAPPSKLRARSVFEIIA